MRTGPPTHGDASETFETFDAFDTRDAFVLTDSRLRRALATLTLGAGLALVVMVARATDCPTVSCATDTDELTDRLGAEAFALLAVPSAYAFTLRGAHPVLAVTDALALLSLGVVSADVSDDGHAMLVAVVGALRLSLMFVTLVRRRNPSFGDTVLVLVTRSALFAFVSAYSCRVAIPDLCGSIAFPVPLRPAATLAIETIALLAAVAHVVAQLREPVRARTSSPPDASAWVDVVSSATMGASAVLDLLIIPLRFSIASALMLLAVAAMDASLAVRLWTDGRARWWTSWRTLSLPLIVLPATISLVATGPP